MFLSQVAKCVTESACAAVAMASLMSNILRWRHVGAWGVCEEPQQLSSRQLPASAILRQLLSSWHQLPLTLLVTIWVDTVKTHTHARTHTC